MHDIVRGKSARALARLVRRRMSSARLRTLGGPSSNEGINNAHDMGRLNLRRAAR
jgi:hypothetical protein